MCRTKGEGAASWFEVIVDGRSFRPSMQHRWKTNEQGMQRLLAAHRLDPGKRSLSYVRYFDDFSGLSSGLLPFPWVGPAIFPCRWVGPRVRAGRSLTCRFACQRARRGSRVKGRTQSGRAAMRSTLDAGEVRP